MDENKAEEERTTRSGRKISGGGKALKRKRTPDSDINTPEPISTKARMDGKGKEKEKENVNGAAASIPSLSSVNFTWEQLTTYMSGEFEKNRRETVARFNVRIDATEADLSKHKKEVRVELEKIREDCSYC